MNKSESMKDAVVLLTITSVSGFLLGGVCQLTEKPIELAIIATNNKAYEAVFAEAETFDSDEALTAAILVCNEALAGMNFGGMEVENVLKITDVGGNQLGHVITSLSNSSYGGAVELSVGLKDDGTITGIEFLEISNTPGPGLKAKEPALKGQYVGKSAPGLSVIKSGSMGDTQTNAINGATITSSATTNTVDIASYYLHNRIQ